MKKRTVHGWQRHRGGERPTQYAFQDKDHHSRFTNKMMIGMFMWGQMAALMFLKATSISQVFTRREPIADGE
jgi:hypothetical protein